MVVAFMAVLMAFVSMLMVVCMLVAVPVLKAALSLLCRCCTQLLIRSLVRQCLVYFSRLSGVQIDAFREVFKLVGRAACLPRVRQPTPHCPLYESCVCRVKPARLHLPNAPAHSPQA